MYVPTTSPESIKSLIKEQGAEVIVHGDVWDETDKEARRKIESLPGGTGTDIKYIFYSHI